MKLMKMFGLMVLCVNVILGAAEPTLEWNKKFASVTECEGNGIVQTTDGGFLVLGIVEAQFLDYDSKILKLDPAGSLEWSKDYPAIYTTPGRRKQGEKIWNYANFRGNFPDLQADPLPFLLRVGVKPVAVTFGCLLK